MGGYGPIDQKTGMNVFHLVLWLCGGMPISVNTWTDEPFTLKVGVCRRSDKLKSKIQDQQVALMLSRRCAKISSHTGFACTILTLVVVHGIINAQFPCGMLFFSQQGQFLMTCYVQLLSRDGKQAETAFCP